MQVPSLNSNELAAHIIHHLKIFDEATLGTLRLTADRAGVDLLDMLLQQGRIAAPMADQIRVMREKLKLKLSATPAPSSAPWDSPAPPQAEAPSVPQAAPALPPIPGPPPPPAPMPAIPSPPPQMPAIPSPPGIDTDLTAQPTPLDMAAIPTPLSAPAAGPVDLGPPPPSGQSNTMPFLAVAATLGGNSPSHGREWVDGLLRQAVERGASDLHIHVGYAPMVRENGNLAAFELPLLSAEDTEGGLMEILSPDQREAFEQNHDLDLAYAIEGVARFRVNIFRQRRGVDAVFRVVPLEAPSLADLGLPESLGSFTEFHNGMVLFTGPAGCGKSTTLAAMVKLLNHSRRHHIITVEDPVEFVHPSEQCIVNHRQVHQHTESFGRALRAALREDPDVIVVGELRDLESIQLAITAAETGHLVMGTLHTTGAIRTIYRMLDVFPPNQQAQIRVMLSESLRGIISQRLVPAIRTLDGPVRVPILEVLNVTPAVSNLIRDEKMFQIRSIMQTGRSQGMCTLEDSLEDLLKKQLITRQDAMRYAIDKERFIAQRGGP